MPSYGQITGNEIDRWLVRRWRARTDLLYLCGMVGFDKVNEKLNGTLIARLQQFKKPAGLDQMREHDRFNPDIYEAWRAGLVGPSGMWTYEPLCDRMDLSGKRRRLILDSRSFMKTTINCTAHSIQWAVNYPDISILIFQSDKGKARDIIRGTKRPFIASEMFRKTFPEHCPWGETELGRMDSDSFFCTFARPEDVVNPQPTFQAISLESGTAGKHVDVMKFSDIVEPRNAETVELCDKIFDRFWMSKELLRSAKYWIDVEGTRYHFRDTYGRLIDMDIAAQTDEDGVYKRDESKREWEVYMNCCYELQRPDPPTYDYDDIGSPVKLEGGGTITQELLMQTLTPQPCIARWPEEHPTSELEKIRVNKPEVFWSQKMINPIGGEDGTLIFRVDEFLPRVIERKDFQRLRISKRVIAIDLAYTTSRDSDFSAMTVGAFDSKGRLYIEDLVHARVTQDQIIDRLFALAQKYRPEYVLMEKMHYEEAIKPLIRRRQDYTNQRFRIVDVTRPGTLSKGKSVLVRKRGRIQAHLQGPYANGDIVFLSDLPRLAWEALLNELKTFPKGYDDILDTIADLWGQGRSWMGKETGGELPETEADKQSLRAQLSQLPFGMGGDAMRNIWGGQRRAPRHADEYYRRTGGF